MAWCDPTRTRFRLTPGELAAAAIVGTHGTEATAVAPDAADDLAALDAAGLTAHGDLDPYVHLLLDTLAASALEVLVTVDGAGRAEHLAWSLPEVAVVAVDVGDEQHEYTVVEPALAPWTLAVAVGLGARPEAGDREPLTVPRATLEEAVDHLEVRAAGAAGQVLRAALDPTTAERLHRLLLDRRCSWQVAARRTVSDGPPHAVEATVYDGGPSGYWLVETDTEQRQDATELTLVPVAPSVLWEMLGSLTEDPPEPTGAADDDPAASPSPGASR